MNLTENSAEAIWQILGTVTDPEVPVLTVLDLGIIRSVHLNGDEVEVVVTPTYSGCPATDAINMAIRMALLEKGYKNIRLTQSLSPAWTTDWMSEEGKQKLQQYGIAPPKGMAGSIAADGVECPQCRSTNTRLLSEFGSTACKALYQCSDCKEPFDYFKCH